METALASHQTPVATMTFEGRAAGPGSAVRAQRGGGSGLGLVYKKTKRTREHRFGQKPSNHAGVRGSHGEGEQGPERPLRAGKAAIQHRAARLRPSRATPAMCQRNRGRQTNYNADKSRKEMMP